MKCPFCQHKISTNAKFCENCGEQVHKNKKHCKQCNFPNEINAKFCSNCHAPFSLLSYQEQVGLEGLTLAEKIEKRVGRYKIRGEKLRLEGKQKEAANLFQEGLDILTSEFGDTSSPALANANAFFHYGIARIHETKGDYHEALKYLTKAQTLLSNLNDLPSRILLAGVHQRKGWNKFRKGIFYDAAMEYYQGLGLLGENTENKQGGMLYQGLGVLFRSLGNNEDAEANLQTSIQIRKKLKDLNGASADLINLGVLYVQQGDYSIGENFYKEALRYKTEIKETEGKAICQANLGYIYYEQERHKEAVKHIKKAIDVLGGSTSQWIVPICLGFLARNALAAGWTDEAEDYIEKAQSIAGGSKDKLNRAKLLELKAMALHQRDDPLEAERYFKQAEILFGSTTLGFDMAVFSLNYAQFLFDLSNKTESIKPKSRSKYRKEAIRLVNTALDVFSRVNNRKYIELCRNLQKSLSSKRRAQK